MLRHILLDYRYSNGGTFTTTSNLASAVFTFNGTAIWIFGAKRDNHGPYNVTLDGQTTDDNGYDPNPPGQFQTPLFSATGLSPGQHVVSIGNTPPSTQQLYLDVDFVSNEQGYPAQMLTGRTGYMGNGLVSKRCGQ